MKLRFRTSKPDRTPDAVMTLTEHLAELRVRIIRASLAVILGAIVIIAFYDPIIRLMSRPYDNLCKRRGADFCGENFSGGQAQYLFLDPLEGLSTRLRVAMYGGIILAIPVIMWQIWRFVVPALKANEKKYAVPFILTSVILFLLGGFLAYLTLERALEFLISWAGEEATAAFRIQSYISLVALMLGAFGVGFQFPVLLVFLQLVGVLQPQQLLAWWRYAIVSVVVVAAVVTPSGDPISLAALSAPMLVLYFAAIGIGLLAQRRAARTEQAVAPSG